VTTALRGRGDVVVVGAGAIGVAAALELAERGASVTIVERGRGVAAGCSAGNAGIVGTSHVEPLASRATVREGLRSLGRSDAPFALRPRPALAPWLLHFLLSARASCHAAGAQVLDRLAAESLALHRALDRRFDTGLRTHGCAEIYETPEALATARAHVLARRSHGLELLDAADARALSPHLALEPAGAVFARDDAHCDPERFVGALAEAASQRGVTLQTGVEVLRVRRRGARALALATSTGDLPIGDVVLATGAWTPRLLRGLPLRVPVQGGKGYHVEFPHTDAGRFGPPLLFPERRVAVTPLEGRLRFTGTLELAGTDLSLDRRRVASLQRQASELVAGVSRDSAQHVWRGLRPCTPDGLPAIGRVPGAENVVLASGHGMWGLQLAPVTARLVADVVDGTASDPHLHALRPERFRGLPRPRPRSRSEENAHHVHV
jgi:D-amino-acid dehydrogenase